MNNRQSPNSILHFPQAYQIFGNFFLEKCNKVTIIFNITKKKRIQIDTPFN